MADINVERKPRSPLPWILGLLLLALLAFLLWRYVFSDGGVAPANDSSVVVDSAAP